MAWIRIRMWLAHLPDANVPCLSPRNPLFADLFVGLFGACSEPVASESNARALSSRLFTRSRLRTRGRARGSPPDFGRLVVDGTPRPLDTVPRHRLSLPAPSPERYRSKAVANGNALASKEAVRHNLDEGAIMLSLDIKAVYDSVPRERALQN